MEPRCFAGVMSGTSLDGVDAVVAAFDDPPPCRVLGAAHLAFPAALRTELLALQQPGPDELARGARAANALAELYAQAIVSACAKARIAPSDLAAAGVHGQTVRHCPGEGFTIQLNNAALVAERAGVSVVADFRSRDVAAGGQGAPLVPAFHHAIFGRSDRHRVVINLGGIANVTDLARSGLVRGFDTGPGNVLLDLWHVRHHPHAAFDAGGAWAASGRVDALLLETFLAEPYFSLAPPKSTGRDLFNAGWLDRALAARGSWLAPADVQATLLALTARAIADALARHASESDEVLVCGGGAHNAALMDALARSLAPRPVLPTSVEGVAVEHVEALAFAWLARAALAGEPGNRPEVTGARGPRVLGAIHPR